MERAKASGKIIVCENLDFEKKKRALRETASKGQRSILSSFAYEKFQTLLQSRCAREGVECQRVNPAFTSIIGFYKFCGYKIYTSHELAALSIARRALGLSERAKTKVTPFRPVRNEEAQNELPEYATRDSVGHVWSFYARNAKGIRRLIVHSSKRGRQQALLYNPRHPSGFEAGRRCDKTVLRCLSP